MVKKLDPAVLSRLFRNVYICQKCNARNRLKSIYKAHCRKCGSKDLRLKRKEKKA